MKIIKASEVFLDGGTIEEIVTDIGIFKRDNKRRYYKLSENGNYYLHASKCESIDRMLQEYYKTVYENNVILFPKV